MTRELLLDAAVRSTLVLALAAIVAHAPRQASAAFRHRVWATAFLGLLALPIASALAPAWRLAVLPAASPSPSLSPTIASPPREPSPTLPPIFAPQPNPIPDEPPAASFPSPPQVVHPPRDLWLLVYLAGLALSLLPVIAGLVVNEVRRKSARPAGGDWSALLNELRQVFGIGRRVDPRVGEDAAIPSTWGVVFPVVLLPAESDSWPEPTRRVVLSHELAHIRRYDSLVHMVSRLGASLFWFQPLAWYALARLRAECEHACDDAVVASGERPSAYAEQLLTLARRLRTPRLATAVGMARTNALEGRMKALFDDRRSHAPLGVRGGFGLAALGVLLALGLATARLAPRSAAADPGPAAPVAPAMAPSSEEPAKPAFVNLPDGPPRRLTGRAVIDAGGAPAAGAEIALWWPPRRPNDGDGHMSGSILKTTKTDADGNFAFDAPPARYRIWATLDKLATPRDTVHCVAVVVPAEDKEMKPVELRLKPAATVTATVKSRADGRPIPGAVVEMGWGVFPEKFLTDASGVVKIHPFSADRWHLEVRAGGFAAETRWLNLENGQDADAEFLLGPGGDLEGVVRDPAGKPVGGVGLSTRTESSTEQYSWDVTDPNGRYTILSAPRDVALTISLSKKGFLRKDVPTRVTGLRQDLDMTIEPRPFGGAVTGTVFDSSGRRIAGALVTNMGNSTDDMLETRTGPDGTFLLENLFTGTFNRKQVVVRAKGFQAVRINIETGPADKPARVILGLAPGHTIKGRVVDENGRPLDKVRVAYNDGNNPFGDGGSVSTDADGRFDLDVLPPDCPFSFSKHGYSDTGNRKLPLDGDGVVEVRMNPAGVIRGRAVDARTGRPVNSFRVRITHSPNRKPAEPSASLWSQLVEPGQVFQSTEGRFQLADLVTGSALKVVVTAAGYEDAAIDRVVVARPSEAHENEYRLAPFEPAKVRTYAGRLIGPDGKPAAGVPLRLVARQPDPNLSPRLRFNWNNFESGRMQTHSVLQYEETVTNADGRFTIPNTTRSGETTIYWWNRGLAPGAAERVDRLDDAAASSIEVVLQAPARVVVTVDRANSKNRQIGGVSLSPSRNTLGRSERSVSKDESQSLFEFEDVAPGEYKVNLNGPAEALPDGPRGAFTQKNLASKTVTVRPGEPLRVEFP